MAVITGRTCEKPLISEKSEIRGFVLAVGLTGFEPATP